MAEQRSISVIAPCLNEEANVRPLVERIASAAQEADVTVEVVLVDDGSTDATWSNIGELERGSTIRVVGVRHDKNRGIPSSWRSGLENASGTYACLIDADLQHPPEEIFTLYRRLLESNDDLVQGTRSSIGRNRDSRLTFSRVLNFFLNACFRMRATDSKSGFLLGPRRVIEDIVTPRRHYRLFQTFVGVAARSKGYRVLEVETLFQSRNAGTSFLQGRELRTSIDALCDFPTAIREFGRHASPAAVAPRLGPDAGALSPYRGWRRALFEAYFATMPLHKWLIGRGARSIYLDLKRTEWYDRDQIAELQTVKLQRLIQHAYVHVPYYRRKMSELGLHPGDILSLDDVSRLPLLNKSDVREHLHFELFADNHRKKHMHRIATSGSTGEPFVTYADKHQLEVRFATTLRAMEWTGWRIGDRQTRLWHQTLGMSRTQVVRERIDSLFMRRQFIPAFEINPENLATFVDQISRHRPVLVDGYAESLNFLASFVRLGLSTDLSPAAVMSSAQALPDNVRETIEAGFRTRVFDKYGSREFSGIAYQCDRSHDHHVMDESYIVELLVDGRPAKPGEIGEIVITDLNNFSVPLIRYRIGDLAVAVDSSRVCECGRSLSRIGRIEGRTQAIVHCADGTWLPGTFFAHFFKDYDFVIRFFQIHQEEKGSFCLRLVKNDQFTAPAFDEMMSALRSYTGSTQIEVEFVDSIPLVKTGKRSPVVSTVREDFQSVPVQRGEP